MPSVQVVMSEVSLNCVCQQHGIISTSLVMIIQETFQPFTGVNVGGKKTTKSTNIVGIFCK